MRKLASIQRIRALEPIEEADAIQKASVLGWELVVKRDEFKVGDLCVYCEIDSLLPDKPEFEFLRSKGFRIRTIRLRGQISQGICFPLSILPPDFVVEEGADCTEALEIVKYEPPVPANLAGLMKGKFPSFIPKTDETRVQVLQRVLDHYIDEPCYITEKLDGTSVTFYFRDGVFGVCSRNLDLVEDAESTYWQMANELQIKEKLASLGGNFALQGEIMGEGIQKNKLSLKQQHVYFFNLFDIDHYQYVNFEDFELIMKQLSLNIVPIIEADFKLKNHIPALVEMAKIRSKLNPAVWAEGIVIRPKIEKIERRFVSDLGGQGRVSFKVINPEFLLKYGE